MVGITVNAIIGYPEGDSTAMPSEDPLQTGYICEGNASGPTGEFKWADTSSGTDYGNGERYETEETRYMTKVRSQNRLGN
jgi:hypothetical protein